MQASLKYPKTKECSWACLCQITEYQSEKRIYIEANQIGNFSLVKVKYNVLTSESMREGGCDDGISGGDGIGGFFCCLKLTGWAGMWSGFGGSTILLFGLGDGLSSGRTATPCIPVRYKNCCIFMLNDETLHRIRIYFLRYNLYGFDKISRMLESHFLMSKCNVISATQIYVLTRKIGDLTKWSGSTETSNVHVGIFAGRHNRFKIFSWCVEHELQRLSRWKSFAAGRWWCRRCRVYAVLAFNGRRTSLEQTTPRRHIDVHLFGSRNIFHLKDKTNPKLENSFRKLDR